VISDPAAAPIGIEAPVNFRWDRLTAASAMCYCLMVSALGVGVVLSELRAEFGINGVIAALHGSTYGIGLILMGVFGVRVVDRLGRHAALQLAVTSLVSGVGLFCIGPSWPITLTGTVFSGCGAALLVMVMTGVISDHHGVHRATAFAAVNAVPGLAGVAFSLLVGAALAAGWSWRPAYIAFTIAITVSIVVIARPVQLPEDRRIGTFTMRHITDRCVLIPCLFIVNAVITEFSVGIWAVTYLREVGNATAAMAPVLASLFGVMMFIARLGLPVITRAWGTNATMRCFLVVGIGATLMCVGPSLWLRVVGLVIAGVGGAPLYPLTIDAFYRAAGDRLDSVTLGAYGALAAGAAVTLGPLALGVLADLVGLRWAILIVPVLSILGAITQRPRRSFMMATT
jgi:MFS family permease